MKNMSDTQIPSKESKNQTLLLVEGTHEKGVLLKIILKCFPELPIDLNNVHVYASDIYDLYHAIEKEYDEDWYETENEINIPLIISRKLNIFPVLDKRKFTNIILIFDYERHDNWYSDEKIIRMQEHFVSPSDDGILYINYPMIESYQHMNIIPDPDYLNRFVPITCNPGSIYKNLVHEKSVIWGYLSSYDAMSRKLFECVPEIDQESLTDALDQVLSLSDEELLLVQTDNILQKVVFDKKMRKTLSYRFRHMILKLGYTNDKLSFWMALRNIFCYIINQNIIKAWKLQESKIVAPEKCIKDMYLEMDLKKVLLVQNEASADPEIGIIWVLCTCVMFLGEYKFFWNV